MKVYVLTEAVDHPWGVNVMAVYSSKEKAVEAIDRHDPHREISYEEYIEKYILEFELDPPPNVKSEL